MFPDFKEIKKQALDIWKNLENKILESNKYNALKEQYQSLNLLYQKLIKYSFIGLLLIAFLYIPLFYFVSATVSWLEFKKKQELSWELLKVRQKNSKMNTSFSSDVLIKRNIEQTVQKYFPEDFDLQQEKTKTEKFINKQKFKLKIPYLNIKQAIQLGTELHNLNFVRLDGIQFTENTEYPKHYNMEYELSSFVLKQSSVRPNRTNNRNNKNRNTRRNKKIDLSKKPNRGKN